MLHCFIKVNYAAVQLKLNTYDQANKTEVYVMKRYNPT